jgi:hypothetical protein
VITGEPKSRIDAIWNAFWSGGIANDILRNVNAHAVPTGAA